MRTAHDRGDRRKRGTTVAASVLVLLATLSGAAPRALADVVSVNAPGELTSGGPPGTGRVTIRDAAPAGGTVVHLEGVQITVPPSVTVPAGQKTVELPVTANNVAAKSVAFVRILGSNTTGRSANFLVLPNPPTTLAFSSASVVGGEQPTGTVTVKYAAPAGGSLVFVTLVDPLLGSFLHTSTPSDFMHVMRARRSSPIWYGAPVTVPEGQKTVSFTLRTSPHAGRKV